MVTVDRDWKPALLARIERYCREKRVTETTFGVRALNDGKAVKRLRAGGGMGADRLQRLHRWLDRELGAPRGREDDETAGVAAPAAAPIPLHDRSLDRTNMRRGTGNNHEEDTRDVARGVG